MKCLIIRKEAGTVEGVDGQSYRGEMFRRRITRMCPYHRKITRMWRRVNRKGKRKVKI